MSEPAPREDARAPAPPPAAPRCPVATDASGALPGFNPHPANTEHDRAALAAYMERWRAYRRGEGTL
jgi:hypothetical protein